MCIRIRDIRDKQFAKISYIVITSLLFIIIFTFAGYKIAQAVKITNKLKQET